ncbi:chaperone protein TorD [Hartmannibacter diazotrophicus]|uniref:Chaperone protein TorD n=1 Tax=Hartmannibacter diazotrophicus TaxID=1482074 RepID=A0A2C9D537_9HYPH|nr:molecular chaperone TorD family protein [Hartmannibacter diazotrophicus]SON55300.1 chaperone protein TorD [Hartmannibacter diazotrophicus]
MTKHNTAIQSVLAEPDQLRVNLYRLLARLLAAPIDSATRATLQSLVGDDTTLGQAVARLAQLAGDVSPKECAEEFHELFVGVGRGELLPYSSYYLTGFLNEKPLARLRRDMAGFQIARSAQSKEPEDHIAALMDMMTGLIDGSFGDPQPISAQKEFFDRHVGKWAPHFFSDLERAKSARFYKPVGTIGRLFMDIEMAAFDM